MQNTQLSGSEKTLEEKLQPWLDQGEYIIVLVLVIMAFSAGWVNLLGYISTQIDFAALELKSVAILGGFVVYTLVFALLFWPIISLKALDRLKQAIAFIQRNPIVFFIILLGFAAIMWSMIAITTWVSLPLLQVAVLILMALFTLVILFAKPAPTQPMQLWRKIAIGIVMGLILLEIVLQALAYFGVLPLRGIAGIGTPYGRIYQSQEGLGDGYTNQYGWYYPEFTLSDDTYRILLNGDTFVQAVQIPMQEHMGLKLQGLLGSDTEVLAQGQLGYGANQFLNPIMYPYIWEPMQPDEIIVFFHLLNDFQLTADDAVTPYVTLNEDSEPVIVDEDFEYWHYLAHIVIEGHDPLNPFRTLSSHSLTLALFANVFGLDIAYPEIDETIERVSEEAPFGPAAFLFEAESSEDAQASFSIAEAQIRTFADEMRANDIEVRLVTIPYFPQAVFDADTASAEFGEYDLLLPERMLQEIALENDIPFLGMGQYLMSNGLDEETVNALYFNEGSGHLTVEGHNAFADAIYDCFYTAETVSQAGCVFEDGS